MQRFLIALFIFSCIVLPSGSVYHVNVKIILTALLLFLFFWGLVNGRGSFGGALSLLGFLSFVVSYLALANLNGVPIDDSISQAQAFFSSAVVIFFPIYYMRVGTVSANFLFLVVVYAFAFMSLFKIVLELYMLAGAGLEAGKTFVMDIFGVAFIGLDAGVFYRIHFPSDYLAPVILFAMLRRAELGLFISKRAALFVFMIALVSVVLSYSRFLWLYSLIATLLAFFSMPKVNLKLLILGFGLILLPVFYILYGDVVFNFVLERYAGDYAKSSDGTRIEMLSALIDAISERPFLGSGLGASTPGYVNIESVPWYYEMQWLGLVMQLGLTGASALFLAALLVAWLILGRSLTLTKLSLTAVYLLWVLLGFFNGFMLTSIGGGIFLAFILAGVLINRRKLVVSNVY
jgi:hypothetical protein